MPLPPGIVDDGDYTKAQQNGAPQISFPYLKFGDNKTFIAKIPMVVDVSYYQPRQPMTQRWFPNLGRAYLIDYEGPQETPQRLMYYNEIYGNVPQTRIEYGSTTFKQQDSAYDEDGANARITAVVDVFDAEHVFEYSIGKPLPQIFWTQLTVSPRGIVVEVGNSTTVNTLNRMLSQNTTSRVYGGKIFERLSVFALVTRPKKLIGP